MWLSTCFVLFVAIIHQSVSFYVPGVAPIDFTENQQLEVKVRY